ncbi:unnamed protein product, partial [Rotaria magnacalcarata]
LTKAYLTNLPTQPSITSNKTLSEAPTNRHDDQLTYDYFNLEMQAVLRNRLRVVLHQKQQ